MCTAYQLRGDSDTSWLGTGALCVSNISDRLRLFHLAVAIFTSLEVCIASSLDRPRWRATVELLSWYFSVETPHSTGGTNTFARECPRLQCAVLAVCIGRFELANATIYGEPGPETQLR